MTDSGEPVTHVQEPQSADSESKSQENEVTKNSKKRLLDTNEDEDLENTKIWILEYLKKTRKRTARKLKDDFKPTTKNDDDDDNELPLDCSICKNPFSDPVVTNCKHVFCEQCALKHYAEDNKCFVCKEPTLGFFKAAVEVKERIAKERDKARAMVKDVSEIVEKASVMVDDAGDISEKAVKMVEVVETLLVAKAATEAGETAVKAAEMVQSYDHYGDGEGV